MMTPDFIAGLPTALFIGGKWCEASDHSTFEVIDPATEQPIAEVSSATEADAIGAVGSAAAVQVS
jgi:succinate-semialdehyde dehydrogenase/glutarate-semialdehyde dehydrogenase